MFTNAFYHCCSQMYLVLEKISWPISFTLNFSTGMFIKLHFPDGLVWKKNTFIKPNTYKLKKEKTSGKKITKKKTLAKNVNIIICNE